MKLLVLAIMATLTLAVGALRPIEPDDFRCEAQGYFAKPGNCKFLYKCKSEGGQFKQTLHRCPDHHLFDENKKKCIDFETKDITCTGEDYTIEEYLDEEEIPEGDIDDFFNELKPIKVNGYIAKPGNCKYYIKWEWSDNKPNKISFLEIFKCPAGKRFNMYGRCVKRAGCEYYPAEVVAEATEGTPGNLQTILAAGMGGEAKVFSKPGNCKLFYSWKGIKGTNGMSDSIELKLMQCPKDYRFIESEGTCRKEGQTGYEECEIDYLDDYSGAELFIPVKNVTFVQS